MLSHKGPTFTKGTPDKSRHDKPIRQYSQHPYVRRVELLILHLTVIDAIFLKINHKHLKVKDGGERRIYVKMLFL